MPLSGCLHFVGLGRAVLPAWHAGAVEELEDIRRVARQHGVVVAYIFGSRASGTARPDSDLDLAVLVDGAPSAATAVGALADALERVTGTTVDVVDLDRASIELRGKVAQEGALLLSDDEPRRVAFEVDARNRWFDFRPMLEATTRGFLDRVAAEGLR